MRTLRVTLVAGLLTSACVACAHWGPAGGSDRLTAADTEILRSVADSVVKRVPESAPLCISLMGEEEGGRYSTPDLVRLISNRASAVPGGECPRTYAQMIQPLDSLGRPILPPENHVDPYHLVLGRPQYAERHRAQVHAILYYGTGGTVYSCEAYPFPERLVIRCHMLGSWLS